MSISISPRGPLSIPEQELLLPILLDSQPRPQGTLTLWQEKVRLASPRLKEQLLQAQSSGCGPNIDIWYFVHSLTSAWDCYPEPSGSFISKPEVPQRKELSV